MYNIHLMGLKLRQARNRHENPRKILISCFFEFDANLDGRLYFRLKY
jgi:hypothetical protein